MASKRSKRYQKAQEQVSDQPYALNDAVGALKKFPKPKFDPTVTLSFRLGVDPKKSDQMVRGSVSLPHGTGKEMRVAVFAQGAAADAARDAGADLVGMDDLAEQVKKGQLDFDVVVAAPDAMRVVGGLGKILGPRGLMPNPKVGTVTPDVGDAVRKAKAGQVQYRTDKAGIIHCSIGKATFEVSALRENHEALIGDLQKSKPSAAKGVYLQKITVSSTMGPGVPVDKASLGV